MSKPRVITNCVANATTPGNERIIEFSDHEAGPGDGSGPVGGLISFRRTNRAAHDPDHDAPEELVVSVYRCDPHVVVSVNDEQPVWMFGRQVAGPGGPDLRRLLELAESLASCTKDGEMQDGEEFVMENDDAVDTLHHFIGQARVLLGQPEFQEDA